MQKMSFVEYALLGGVRGIQKLSENEGLGAAAGMGLGAAAMGGLAYDGEGAGRRLTEAAQTRWPEPVAPAVAPATTPPTTPAATTPDPGKRWRDASKWVGTAMQDAQRTLRGGSWGGGGWGRAAQVAAGMGLIAAPAAVGALGANMVSPRSGQGTSVNINQYGQQYGQYPAQQGTYYSSVAE